MKAEARRKLFASVIKSHWGLPCPCCKELRDWDDQGEDLDENAKLFGRIFGIPIIGVEAVVAFRLVPIPRGIEKRGEDFFYMLPNLKPACCPACREDYQKMWLYHTGRQEFIDTLVKLQVGTTKKVIVKGGVIK